MQCYAVQHNLTEPDRGISGLRPYCIATLSGFLVGDSIMKLIDISTQKHPNTFAQVDDKDYEWLNQWKWTARTTDSNIYAVRTKNKKNIHMHREILKPSRNMDTDHIDGNGLNNQCANLRECTRSQNLANSKSCRNTSSQYKGVFWSNVGKKWTAQLQHAKNKYHLGYHENEEDAARAYNTKAREVFGVFARLNELQELE